MITRSARPPYHADHTPSRTSVPTSGVDRPAMTSVGRAKAQVGVITEEIRRKTADAA
ncbi:hypothetical protein [Streptosporangium saharense]|uniref:hypothetical protein n=1 Tax=Streptosporangium saharense TaxID=1706840 RepID=UPI0033275C9F